MAMVVRAAAQGASSGGGGGARAAHRTVGHVAARLAGAEEATKSSAGARAPPGVDVGSPRARPTCRIGGATDRSRTAWTPGEATAIEGPRVDA